MKAPQHRRQFGGDNPPTRGNDVFYQVLPSVTSSATNGATTLLRVLQVLAALSALNVLAQFITAGQLFPSGGPEELHAAGAIVLHIISGLAAVVAVVLWRQGTVSLGLMILAVLVFGYTFVQAAIGGYQTLYVHVPGPCCSPAVSSGCWSGP